MKKNDRNQLKKQIMASFLELIENKPGLKEDPDIKDAYEKLKDQAEGGDDQCQTKKQ